MIEFDVETTGLQPFSGDNEAFLWIFSDGTEHEAIPFTPSKSPVPGYGITEWTDEAWLKAKEAIQAWFDRGFEEGIRAWNTKFDRGFADMAGLFSLPPDGMWHDGMLVAHAMDERRSVALKAVASGLFGNEAAAPQKDLKDWLNEENRRRAKVLSDYDKVKVGKLRVKYVEEKPCTCDGGLIWEGVPEGEDSTYELCQDCDEGVVKKNRTRPATDEENRAVLDEYETLFDPTTQSYHRANYSHVPKAIMHPYAIEDVVLTRRVCDSYEAMLANDSAAKADNPKAKTLTDVIEFERKTMDGLYAIEKRGLPADILAYRKLEQEVIGNLTRLSDRVQELAEEADPIVYAKEMGVEIEVSEDGVIKSYKGGGGRLEDFNANSSAQIEAALKARGADLSHMSQKDGKLPMDADNLRVVDDALAAAILEYRAENKVLTTYVRPMLGRSYVSAMNVYKEPFISRRDGRIHATYRQVGARTGRMSCADPNMQNQPRDDLRLRWNIVSDPGMTLVACDLSNIEMVLFAAYCGPGRLLTAVRNGDDLHTLTAKMLGLRDRKRPGGGVETARQLGKTYNFSRIYGGGLRTIRRSFRCSMDEARLLKKRFDDAYPEVRQLQNRIDHKLADEGFVQDTLFSGRRFRVAERDSYKAVNYVVQGTAASLLKDAVQSLHEDGVPMVALVHDEIVCHVPIDEAQEVAELVEKRMTQASAPGGQLWLPERTVTVKEFDPTSQKLVPVTKQMPAGPVVPLRAEAEIINRWSDAKPLKELGEDGEPNGKMYYFDPKWANTERRYVAEGA